jgi:hypothetical protein
VTVMLAVVGEILFDKNTTAQDITMRLAYLALFVGLAMPIGWSSAIILK